MTRRRADGIDVRRRDDVPAEFLWRGRLYVVREVLAHWVETPAWWTGSEASTLLGSDAGTLLGSDGGTVLGSGGGQAALSPRSTSQPAPAAVADGDSGEREVWRVEASAGRACGSGVYDLAFDWSAGGWTLARTID